jgi:hypothetical protein
LLLLHQLGNMASEEADQQVTTNGYARFIQHNKEQLTAELQQSCETQDRVIRDAWKTILDSLQVAQETQSRAFSDYRAGLRENAFRIVTADLLPEITLPSYCAISAHFANLSPRPLLVDTTPVASPALPSPQASPTPSRSQHPTQIIAPSVPGEPHPAPAERSGTLTLDDENAPARNNKRPPKRLVRRPRLTLYHIHPKTNFISGQEFRVRSFRIKATAEEESQDSRRG